LRSRLYEQELAKNKLKMLPNVLLGKFWWPFS
jgi:hypothetical protein